MTGAGLHVLDAFIHLAGPVRRGACQLPRQARAAPLGHRLRDLRVRERRSGLLGTVRATPQYWRVHVFGASGSAEAPRRKRTRAARRGAAADSLQPVDSLRAELEMFADAIEARAPSDSAAQMHGDRGAFKLQSDPSSPMQR